MLGGQLIAPFVVGLSFVFVGVLTGVMKRGGVLTLLWKVFVDVPHHVLHVPVVVSSKDTVDSVSLSP